MAERPAGGGLSRLWATLFSICGGADPAPGQTHSEWVQQATWALPEATEGLGQRRTSRSPPATTCWAGLWTGTGEAPETLRV